MKKGIIGSIIIISLLVSIFGYHQMKYYSIPHYMRSPSSKVHEIGKIVKIQKTDYNTIISVFYPRLKQAKINEEIENFIQATITEFKAVNEHYQPKDKNHKAMLYIDYDAYNLENKLASIIVSIQQTGIINSKISKTWVFDLNSDTLITMQDLFTNHFEEKISVLTRTFFKKQSSFLAKTNSLYFIEKTKGKVENFQEYALTLQELILYFPANSLFADINEELIVTIPLVLMRDYLKIDFDSLASNQDHLSVTERIIDPNLPMVALTYDDGPNKEVTPRILDILKEYDGAATFFVLGARVRNHKEIIKRIVDEGSEIGNHTFGHLDLTRLKRNELLDQYNATQDAISEVLKSYDINLVRPTFGAYNDYVLKNSPYPLILWNIDTLDWSHKNPSRTYDEIISQVKDGDIVLMHDMYVETAQASEKVIVKLKEMGFQLVTISELFEAKEIILEPGKIYRSAH